MGCVRKCSKRCFSLVMYEFRSNNALYSVSLSFTIIIIIIIIIIIFIFWTPFDTLDCYYF